MIRKNRKRRRPEEREKVNCKGKVPKKCDILYEKVAGKVIFLVLEHEHKW